MPGSALQYLLRRTSALLYSFEVPALMGIRQPIATVICCLLLGRF